MTGNSAQRSGRDVAIKMTKAAHFLAWFSIESCVFYLLYAGFTGRSGRRAAIAASVIAGEALVFAGNGFRCPLTDIAERLGADHGSVTDTYLPVRVAHNLPAIHAPLLLTAAYLHRRNIRRNLLSRSPAHPPEGRVPRRAEPRRLRRPGTGPCVARRRTVMPPDQPSSRPAGIMILLRKILCKIFLWSF